MSKLSQIEDFKELPFNEALQENELDEQDSNFQSSKNAE